MCGGITEDSTEEATRTRGAVAAQAYPGSRRPMKPPAEGWLYICAWIFPLAFRPSELLEGTRHLGGVARDASM